MPAAGLLILTGLTRLHACGAAAYFADWGKNHGETEHEPESPDTLDIRLGNRRTNSP
jgi:hypothetical protein